MDIFDFLDYRDYLKSYFKALPQKGYGKLSELSEKTKVNPATISLVLKKERDFTLDQAYECCLYLGLSSLETEYFLNSVNLQKAAKNSLKAVFRDKLTALKNDSQNLQKRLGTTKDLNDQAKSQFYSQWFYSGVRLATSIPELDNLDAIAKRLKLPLATARQVVQFLQEYNLIKETDGKLSMGQQSTHLPAHSILVNRHHTNWRLQGIQAMKDMQNDEMFFTSPVSIAQKDIQKVRELLVNNLDQIFKVIDPSPEEELACLNIDWFRF